MFSKRVLKCFEINASFSGNLRHIDDWLKLLAVKSTSHKETIENNSAEIEVTFAAFFALALRTLRENILTRTLTSKLCIQYPPSPGMLTIALFTSATFCYSQKVKLPIEPTAAKGYYKSLQSFNPKPKSDHEEIDKEKFPYDPASADKRLSLKPYYIPNIKLSDFMIPDRPANSSEQTRAELNYLLSLQQQRTELDIESSIYLASVFYNLRIQPDDSNYNIYRQNLFHVGRTVGTWFNPIDLPLTADLMANVWRDASYVIWGLKYKCMPVRPYVLQDDLQNLEETNWAAYPSGHAANSYINAYIYQNWRPSSRMFF